ncbi:DNA repair protein RadA [Candidatus Gracilibacteria bacterium]|nr:DNA repair protein RadA [Candidatus Gracilibacteria bacterium]
MYICTDCGNESIKWEGQCGFCKEWNTLKEFKESKEKKGENKGEVKNLQNIKNIKVKQNRVMSKSSELNTVMGGGIVQGSVVLLSGEPGIGKSTLAIQLGKWLDEKIIYVSGEETEYQLFDRCNRLGIKADNLSLLSENNLENILETAKNNPSDFLVVDSISVMHSDNQAGVSGSVGQVRYITEKLVEFGKSTNTTIFIIGHITKDGSLAGPKTLEHMVDTVLYFTGDKYDNLRILRTLKNRFGATSEVGIYKMEQEGLVDLKNPGLEFVNSEDPTIGSSLSITMEGTRPIVIETESLTTYTKFGLPKRSARGVNSSKLDLIIAVLGKYTSVNLDSHDVYCNIARGMRIDEPGIDLSLVASIISSKTNKVIPKDTIFIGEISLTGKVKNVMYIEKRVKEAGKMGFKKIIIPKLTKKITSKKIEVIQVSDLGEVVEFV